MKIFVNHVWYKVTSDYQGLLEEIGEDDIFRINGVDMEDNTAHESIFGVLGEDFDLEEVCKALEIFETVDEFLIAAYLNCFNAEDSIQETVDKANEAYVGSFDSDIAFARDMAEAFGRVQHNAEWPFTCIDWEQAAKELMQDYVEDNHYYFRNV